MKRSKKVELVLITAVLAACSRTLVPPVTGKYFPEDSALIAAPAERDSTCDPCNDQIQSAHDYLLSDTRVYCCSLFSIFPYQPYYPGKVYRKGTIWTGGHVIVRGGFGKSWLQSSSS